MTASESPRRFRNLPLADVASRRIPVAVDLPSRLLGLALLRPERAGAGLLIPRCRSVHTFGMRFAIDVVFLDRKLRPIAICPSIGPGRVLRDPRAAAVAELPSEAGG
jgi:hypothetical protein